MRLDGVGTSEEVGVHELVSMLRASRRTVVFTGAGVSTLSGLPDFSDAVDWATPAPATASDAISRHS